VVDSLDDVLADQGLHQVGVRTVAADAVELVVGHRSQVVGQSLPRVSDPDLAGQSLQPAANPTRGVVCHSAGGLVCHSAGGLVCHSTGVLAHEVVERICALA